MIMDIDNNDTEPHFIYDQDMSNEEWEAMLKAALENYKKKKLLNSTTNDK